MSNLAGDTLSLGWPESVNRTNVTIKQARIITFSTFAGIYRSLSLSPQPLSQSKSVLCARAQEIIERDVHCLSVTKKNEKEKGLLKGMMNFSLSLSLSLPAFPVLSRFSFFRSVAVMKLRFDYH
jgi:hypothetical protein